MLDSREKSSAREIVLQPFSLKTPRFLMPEPDITWTHPFLFEFLKMVPESTQSLVDLGCGRGIVGALMRIYRSVERLVGVDAFTDYLRFCRRHHLYDECTLYDLRRTPLPFRDKEFEVVTCLETIEHLPKPLGERLLDELERIADLCIVSTVNQNRDLGQSAFDGNVLQKHRSVWSVSDFKKRGYKVRGAGELKLNIPYLRFFLSKFGYMIPSISQSLLARKELFMSTI